MQSLQNHCGLTVIHDIAQSPRDRWQTQAAVRRPAQRDVARVARAAASSSKPLGLPRSAIAFEPSPPPSPYFPPPPAPPSPPTLPHPPPPPPAL
eukprot:5616225-Pyramimonas_sp.AAC.1